jgi:hypothetical protein
MSFWTFVSIGILILWAAFLFAAALTLALHSWVDYSEQKHALSKALRDRIG